MEEFVSALRCFHQIYREKGSIGGAELYLVKFHCDNGGALQVTCTDLFTSFWSLSLSFYDLRAMREEMGLEDESWGRFLGRLHNALLTDCFSMKDRGDYIKITVETELEGDPLPYIFRIARAGTSHPRHLIAAFMLDMTKQLQIAQKQQTECLALQKKVSQLEQQIDAHQSFPSSLDAFSEENDRSKPNVVSTQQKAKTSQQYRPRRKPGYSLVNPHSKRTVARGARIGED